jgi:hypothetical protein
MISILNVSGGGCRSLARQAVAAALNESVLDKYDYPGGNTQLILDVRNAFASCNCNSLAVTLDGLNNREGANCSALTKLAVAIVPIAAPTVTTTSTSKIESVGFDTYPVPFKDELTIRYNFDYHSEVTIEVFDSQGNLVFTKIDTDGYFNKEITINLNSIKGQEQVFIVKLTTNRGSSIKKIMSSR